MGILRLLIVPSVLATALPAFAQGADANGDETAAAAPDPSRPAGASDLTPAYAVALRAGVEQAVAGNLEEGVVRLRQAIQMEPSAPDAHYYLGTVLRKKGDLDGALASFKVALERAAAVSDPGMRGRALFAIADTLERKATLGAAAPLQGEAAAALTVKVEALEEAKGAWNQIVQFAEGQRDVINPELARTRMQAIERTITQERAYVPVRERIKAREEKAAAEAQH